jgi:WD40 repeat protein
MPVGTTTASFTPTAAFTPTGTHTPFPTSTPTTTPYPQPEAVFSPENADQIRQLTRLGKGKVNALSYSPDGNYLAVGTSIGVVLYDTHTWSETLIDIEDRVDTLEFAPKGDILAVGLNNGTVQLLQVPGGTLARTFVYNTVAPLNVEKIYDRGNYQGIRYQRNAGETERVLAFSSDGEYLAAGGWDGTVRLWQVADGTLLKTIHGEFMINDIAFHPGERSVAIVDGSDVTEWQFADGGDTEPLQADLTYNTWESSYDWFDRIAF